MNGPRIFGVLCLLLLLEAQTASSQPPGPSVPPARGGGSDVELIATEQLEAMLVVRGDSIRITGRVSLDLARSTVDRDSGRVQVRALNVVFFSVPQRLLAGRIHVSRPLGVLGIGLTAARAQPLRYVEGDSVLEGSFDLLADASFLSALPSTTPVDSLRDFTVSPRIPMSGSVRLRFRDVLPASDEGLQRTRAEISLNFDAASFTFGTQRFPAFHIQTLQPAPLVFDAIWRFCFERVRKLCIQPVRLLRIQWVTDRWGFPKLWAQMTGDGLDFGMPAARAQWRKCDVIFEVREWITLLAGDYWELTFDEETELIGKVDEDDCIEVFFVYDFDPWWRAGCGETRNVGTTSVKIVTSDRNFRGGIDFTHLAHELGHVFYINHPTGDPSDAPLASSGTLMCQSECLEDNPSINSQENCGLVSNSLLTYSLAPEGPNPDCNDSSDCGPCPPPP